MKIFLLGFFAIPCSSKEFLFTIPQAHNALKAWMPQRGAADLQESRAALQRDLRNPLVTLRGVTERLTKAKEPLACSYHFGPPVLEILSLTGARPVEGH